MQLYKFPFFVYVWLYVYTPTTTFYDALFRTLFNWRIGQKYTLQYLPGILISFFFVILIPVFFKFNKIAPFWLDSDPTFHIWRLPDFSLSLDPFGKIT